MACDRNGNPPFPLLSSPLLSNCTASALDSIHRNPLLLKPGRPPPFPHLLLHLRLRGHPGRGRALWSTCILLGFSAAPCSDAFCPWVRLATKSLSLSLISCSPSPDMGSRRGRRQQQQQQEQEEGSQPPHPRPAAAGRGGRAQQAPQGGGRGGNQGRPSPVHEAHQQQPRGRPGEHPGRGHARGRGGTGTRPQQYPRAGAGAATGGQGSSTGPSSPLAPELRQAMQAPHELPQASPLQAGPSQSPPEIQPMEEHKLAAGHQAVPAIPSSSKSLRFPLRPGKGSVGIRCLVKANHFFAQLPDKDLHHYDVRPL